eukprot:CAMPEP_0172702354 /NCGR_PEP_ID=MMETSP1074-20121228/34007_1 /TAXON_ID=2916 /ORGANISM="Ceratium fusus, Strain PA161109" /LENGTH=31 /DNA_ID= /DNA_START= /DNA_END= /DNA_ORIENTATION=
MPVCNHGEVLLRVCIIEEGFHEITGANEHKL